MLFRCNQVQQNKLRKNLKQQQGVVIVVALFIVALVAAMSYAMIARLERDVLRTTLILQATEEENVTAGSVTWAIDQLRNNFEEKKPDQLIDVMPIQSPVDKVQNYQVSSVIYDEESRFNLNNLTDPAAKDDFYRLLRIIDPKLTEENAYQLINALVDWVAPITQENQYTKYYLEQPVPYRPAHRLMQSVSEMRLVQGMTPELYRAISPYVTALPKKTLINVQTASAPVLASLGPSLNLESANALIELRRTKPFIQPEQFMGSDIIKNHPVDAKKISTLSGYFLVVTTVKNIDQESITYTLLERIIKNDRALVKIVWQGKNS